MANERNRMTDDSMRGGMGERQGGGQPGRDSAERDEPMAEHIRGTGDDQDEDEFEEAGDLDEEEDEEESGTI